MKKPKPLQKSPTSPRPPWTLGLLPAAVVGLIVARPLVTSDAAAREGDGAVFVMLWILLAGVWLFGQLRSGKLAFRCGVVDLLFIALIFWHSIAAIVAVETASPRPALNLLWEWVGFGLMFLLVRQIFTLRAQTRAVAAAMIALSVGVAAIGLYQFYVTAPETRRLYEEIKDDPAAMLREVGEWYPPGTPERERFENRLASTEPSATFALANSLAGFLAPWLIVALGVAAIPRSGQPVSWRAWFCVTLLAAPLITCLILTKSRAAWLAVALGAPLLWLVARKERGAVPLRLLAIFAVLVAGATLAAAQTGALDREVLSEAGKSLGYRLQYWRSTLAMIGADPLLGVGPGQFQNRYTAFKLPEASEEVQDPHNFLLEVAATAGLPALLLLLATLAAFTARVFLTPSVNRDPAEKPYTIHLFGGAVAGVFAAEAIGALVGFPLDVAPLGLVLIAMAATLFLLRPWVQGGRFTPAVCWAAAVVLLVNLLAAGGISYPGVAGSLWLLVALGLNLADAGQKPRGYPIHTAWIALALVGLLAVICYVTAYRPVLGSQGAIARSLSAEMLSDPVARAALLQEAHERDPYSAEIAREWAAQRFALWEQNPTPQRLAAWEEALAATLVLDPDSSTTWSQCGRWRQAVAQTTRNADALAAAIAAHRRAVELYPTSAVLRANLAQALLLAGDRPAAAEQATEALRLDEIVAQAGHRDRVLAPELRQELLRIKR